MRERRELAMSNTKHTPGPWIISARKNDDAIEIDAPFVETLAEVYGKKHDLETCEANAHLIKTAPQLLAALKSIVESTSDVYDWKFWYERPQSCINDIRKEKAEKWASLLSILAKAEGK